MEALRLHGPNQDLFLLNPECNLVLILFGFVGQYQCFEPNTFSYRKPVKGTQYGQMWWYLGRVNPRRASAFWMSCEGFSGGQENRPPEEKRSRPAVKLQETEQTSEWHQWEGAI